MNNDTFFKNYSGNQLKKIRLENGMTQKEIVNKLVEQKRKRNETSIVTRQTISKYETGERGMSLETISDLANIFKIPVNYFFPNQETLNQQIESSTKEMFSETLGDDENFSIEIKTSVPFYQLSEQDQKKIMDSALEELLTFKDSISKNKFL